MKFKEIIKGLLPNILLQKTIPLRRSIKYFFGKKPTYRKDIYYKYEDIKETFQDPFESKNWLSHIERSINYPKKSPGIHESNTLLGIKFIYHLLHPRKITLIDYGGGFGTLYTMTEKLSREINFDINSIVIDNTLNINKGKTFFKENKNLKFYDYKTTSALKIIEDKTSEGELTLLNLSSVIQYIHPYKQFISDLLKNKKPLIVCITRFPRCEDSSSDAFAIQDITSSDGFCGSTIVNLFGKDSIKNLMDKLGYDLLTENFNYLGDHADYFFKCENKSFKSITLVAYTFIKK